MKFIVKIKKLIENEIANEDFFTLQKSKRKLRGVILFVVELCGSIKRHQTFNTAAALSFKTIVAIVPLIFIGIAVASMLGVSSDENYVNSFITALEEKIPDVPELKPLLGVIRSFALKAKEIVGLSFVILFYVAYSLLAYIERSFNNIWQVEGKRLFVNRIVAYLAVIIVVPIMMSFSVYLNSKVETATIKVAQRIENTKDDAYEMFTSYLPFYDVSAELTPKEEVAAGENNIEGKTEASIGHQPVYVKVVLGIFSFLLTSAAVSLLIFFMPFTPVKFIAAILGGGCSGLILEAMKFGFSMYVNYAATNLTRLYGSTLLVLPLFLLWLWLVWVVLLFGAELAFNWQNYYDLVARSQLKRKSVDFKFYLAVRVVYMICESFYSGKVTKNIIDELAQKFVVPPLVIRKIIEGLADVEVIRVVDLELGSFVPGKDLSHLNLLDVYAAINEEKFEVPEGTDALHTTLQELIGEVREDIKDKLEATSFLSLVEENSREVVGSGD